MNTKNRTVYAVMPAFGTFLLYSSQQFAMLTNIIEEKTELLYVGKGAQELVRMAFKKECGEHSVVLPGVVSRKKQMVTPLLGAMEEEAGL